MQDYQPLDLSTLCNVGPEAIGENANPAISIKHRAFTGYPFRLDRQGILGESVLSDLEKGSTPIRLLCR